MGEKADSPSQGARPRDVAALGIDVLEGQVPGLQALVGRLSESASSEVDRAHHMLVTLDEITADAQRIQRLAARVLADGGMSARQIASSIGSSHHTVQSWVHRSRAEFH